MLNHPITRAVFKRDLRSWFTNPTGYVFITLFTVVCALALVGPDTFFRNNLANLASLNAWFPYVLLLFVPAVTMGMWAGERANGTQELLFTLPAKDWQILLGKFLAAAGIYTVSLAFTLVLPVVLGFLGSPDIGLIFANYVGFWLFGLLLISVSMLGSQLTENLTVSFILGVLLCAVVVFSRLILEPVFPGMARSWALYGPLGLFGLELSKGLISLAAILLYAGLIWGFLYLNLALIQYRHWRRGMETGTHRGVRFVALVAIAISLGVFGFNELPRVDTTVERIHSLSPKTENLIGELDPERPVVVQAFISEDVPTEYVQARRNVLDLLRRYDALGGEAVQVRIVETEPYSEEADRAEQSYGIRPRTVPVQEGGSIRQFTLYMGLAFQCGPEQVVMPFLGPNAPVEYEITRSIRSAAQTDRRKVGVVKTELEIFGGFDFQARRQNPRWELVEELDKQYDIENVDPAQEYPDDLDMLLVPQVSLLTQEQMDALAAYIEAGNPTVLIDDPFPAFDPSLRPSQQKGGQRNPMMRQQNQEQKGDVSGLLRRFGVAYQPREIVWDSFSPHQILATQKIDYLEWVFVNEDSGADPAFNPDSVITSGLQEVMVMWGGHATELAEEDDLDFVPLLQTSPRGGHVMENDLLRMASPLSNAPALNPNPPRLETPGEDVLACRVRGKPARAEAETEGEEKDDAGEVDLIFLADVDMVSPVFFNLRQTGLGNTQIQFDNVPFILNCIDVLAGDESFVELRKRRPKHRVLTKFEEQRGELNQEFLAAKKEAEEEAEEELGKAQDRLDEAVAEIEQRTDLDSRAKQIKIQERRNIEQRKLDTRKEMIEREKQRKLRLARGRLHEQEDRLKLWYRIATPAISALLPILVGILMFVRRRRREARIVPVIRKKRGAA